MNTTTNAAVAGLRERLREATAASNPEAGNAMRERLRRWRKENGLPGASMAAATQLQKQEVGAFVAAATTATGFAEILREGCDLAKADATTAPAVLDGFRIAIEAIKPEHLAKWGTRAIARLEHFKRVMRNSETDRASHAAVRAVNAIRQRLEANY